jgi:glycosyltransferase involved in cell wall biosynthesis
MEELLVSISCITYNHAPYIRACLDGFLMQKTNFQFEVLIHDDASTDGTTEIIREYEIKYPEIIKPLYEEENQWVKGKRGSAYFNFPRAKGKYIALCEGDDYWTDPLKLQRQVDFLESNPEYSMCFHNAIVLQENDDYRIKRFNSISNSRTISINELIDKWLIPTASIFFRRELSQNIPNWVFSIYSGDLSLELFLADAGKVYCFRDFMSVYRENTNGVSVSKYSAKFVAEQHIKLFTLFNEYYGNKYHNIVKNKIKKVKRYHRYLQLSSQSYFIAFLLMPIKTSKEFLKHLIIWSYRKILKK